MQLSSGSRDRCTWELNRKFYTVSKYSTPCQSHELMGMGMGVGVGDRGVMHACC